MVRRALLVLVLVFVMPAFGNAGAAALAASPSAVVSAAAMPTVVELFTSQGCNSCPPADAFLTELAHRPEVVALTYDVDYWNYLGWRDTFATRETTGRQKAYAERLSNGELYTPEMVVGGEVAVTGADRAAVETAIARVARSQKTTGIALKVTRDAAGGIEVALPARLVSKPAVVWLIGYDKARAVKIMQGENRGRTITYTNVVRLIRAIGRWSGGAEAITVDPALLRGTDQALVLVQVSGAGRIVGCVKLPAGKGA